MNPNKGINWPGLTHTWNPAVGCKRGCCKATHGFDCYARALHEQRRSALLAGKKMPKQYLKPFDEMQWFTERFHISNSKKPRVVFVGSMTDIAFWERWQIETTLQYVRYFKNDTFMFCTKSGIYKAYKWPVNAMCGTTITFWEHEKYGPINLEILDDAATAPRPFLSVEPLLGCMPRYDYSVFERVIVGPDNSSGAPPPKPEWIQSVKDNVPEKILWWK